MLENESLLAASNGNNTNNNNTSLSLVGHDADEVVVLGVEDEEDGANDEPVSAGGSESSGRSSDEPNDERVDQTLTVLFPSPQIDKESFSGPKKVDLIYSGLLQN